MNLFCSAAWLLVWGRVSFENSAKRPYNNLKEIFTALMNRISLIKVANLLLLLFALKLLNEFCAFIRNREFTVFLFFFFYRSHIYEQQFSLLYYQNS